MKFKGILILFILIVLVTILASANVLAANLTIDKVYQKVTNTELTSYKFYLYNTTLTTGELYRNTTEGSTTSDGLVLKETYTPAYALVDNISLTGKKTGTYTNSVKIGFTYNDETSYMTPTYTTFNELTYETKTVTNPYPLRLVKNISIYYQDGGSSTTAYLINTTYNGVKTFKNYTYNNTYKSNDLPLGTYNFYLYNSSPNIGVDYYKIHNGTSTTNITNVYNTILDLGFLDSYTDETIEQYTNYTLTSGTFTETGYVQEFIALNWTNVSTTIYGYSYPYFNSNTTTITPDITYQYYDLYLTPIALYLTFTSTTNITIYHTEGINVTANNNSIYIYQPALPIGKVTIAWNEETQKISYYNTQEETFTANLYNYIGLTSSDLDAPRRFRVTEDGASSENARIIIEISNGTAYNVFMGDLTDENGEVDIELIGGLTYRYTVYKEGYNAVTGLLTVTAPPTGSEIPIIQISLTSTQEGESKLYSSCTGTVTPNSNCTYSFVCGSTSTCTYNLTKNTYTNTTNYTTTTYTGSTLASVTGYWNTTNTTYKETITGTVNTDTTLNTLTLYIQQTTKNTTYQPIKLTDIQDPDDYKIWFITLMFIGIIIGIIFETRILSGSGVFATAAIWGLSSTFLPSMLIPTLILLIPMIAIGLWKRFNKDG